MTTVTSIGTPSYFQQAGSSSPKTIQSAWGTGQTRAAGDLLVALVTASGLTSAGPITENTSYGWTKIYEDTDTRARTAILILTATGGDSAPIFQSNIVGTSSRCGMSVRMYQLHGDNNATPVVDTGGAANGTGTVAATTGAAVAGSGEYAIAGQALQGSSSGTCTWGAVGSWTATPDGISAYYHFVSAYLANPTSGVTLTYNPTHTASATGVGAAIAVFKGGVEVSYVTGSVSMKKMTASGSGAGLSEATGSVNLKKITVSASGTAGLQARVRSNSSYASTVTETGFTLPLPSGWQAGDVCYAVVEARATSATIPTPSGWSPVAPVFNPTGSTNTVMAVFRRVLQAGDGGMVVSGTISSRFAAVGTAVQDADSTVPEDGVAVIEEAQSGATNNPVADSITPSGANDLLLCFFGATDPVTANVAMTFSPPAGMTLEGQASSAIAAYNDAAACITSLRLTSNSPTGTKTATVIPSSGSSACSSQAVTLVVRTARSDLSGVVNLKKMGVSGSGGGISGATGNIVLKKMRISGSLLAVSEVTGAIVLKKVTVSGVVEVTAVPSSDASGIVTLKKMTVAGSGTGTSVASGTVKLKKMTVAGTSHEVSVATGNVSMKKMIVAGTSHEVSVATGNVSMKKMRFSGSGTGKSVASGIVTMFKMEVRASQDEEGIFSGNIVLKKMTVHGESAERSSASGSIVLKKMTVHGESGERSSASGSIVLKKMTVHGESGERSSASGSISLKKIVFTGSVVVTEAEVSEASGEVFLKKMLASGAATGISSGSGEITLKRMKVQASSTVIALPPSDLFVFSIL